MYEKQYFSLYFLKPKPWDPSKKLDLAICYTGKNNCSVRFNLTDLVTKEGCKLASKKTPFHRLWCETACGGERVTTGNLGSTNSSYLYSKYTHF